MCVIVPMGCYVCGIVTVWYTGACGDNRGNCRSIMWPGASKGQQGQRREGGWETTNFDSGKYEIDENLKYESILQKARGNKAKDGRGVGK